MSLNQLLVHKKGTANPRVLESFRPSSMLSRLSVTWMERRLLGRTTQHRISRVLVFPLGRLEESTRFAFSPPDGVHPAKTLPPSHAPLSANSSSLKIGLLSQP